MMNSLVLSSGGIDSTVVLEMAMQNSGQGEVQTISFFYAQRHAREIEAARQVSAHYGVQHHIIEAPIFAGESVLMDNTRDMPHLTYKEIEAAQGPSPTYVPFRNGTFLSIASGLALHRGVDTLWVGMHAEDARGWAYPDCTPEFIGSMQNAIYVGTYHKVRMVAPLTYVTKEEIVKWGINNGVPFHLTWSCYEGGEVACGRCPTCVSRLEAFSRNGASDPIPYYTREVVSG